MGYYINPPNMEKEAWLKKYGINPGGVSHIANAKFGSWKDPKDRDLLPVCLIDNGKFTAAGVAYNEMKLRRYLMPDHRPKRWFLVAIEDLLKIKALPRWPL